MYQASEQHNGSELYQAYEVILQAYKPYKFCETDHGNQTSQPWMLTCRLRSSLNDPRCQHVPASSSQSAGWWRWLVNVGGICVFCTWVVEMALRGRLCVVHHRHHHHHHSLLGGRDGSSSVAWAAVHGRHRSACCCVTV